MLCCHSLSIALARVVHTFCCIHTQQDEQPLEDQYQLDRKKEEALKKETDEQTERERES
jgi:hypothetical protein